MIFDKDLLNEGKAYDKRIGNCTAMVNGNYLFIWNTLANAGKYLITEIDNNRNRTAFNHCDENGIGSGHVSS